MELNTFSSPEKAGQKQYLEKTMILDKIPFPEAIKQLEETRRKQREEKENKLWEQKVKEFEDEKERELRMLRKERERF